MGVCVVARQFPQLVMEAPQQLQFCASDGSVLWRAQTGHNTGATSLPQRHNLMLIVTFGGTASVAWRLRIFAAHAIL